MKHGIQLRDVIEIDVNSRQDISGNNCHYDFLSVTLFSRSKSSAYSSNLSILFRTSVTTSCR